MRILNQTNLKLAIQKEGRLTDETLSLLRQIGLNFESYRHKLFVTSRNFPVDILYVRDDDIPNYVATGIADLGIVGQNIVFESKQKVKKLLNLRFGICSLAIAVPEDSTIKAVEKLKGRRIATSYPNSTKEFFKRINTDVRIIKISGSVEITPALGIAEAVADIVATGSTLAMNGLRVIKNISDSEAVLISTPKKMDSAKSRLIGHLTDRIKTVISARNYKFISFLLPKNEYNSIKKIIPILKDVSLQNDANYVNIQVPIKEEILWETIERIKLLGGKKITVMPVENIIN